MVGGGGKMRKKTIKTGYEETFRKWLHRCIYSSKLITLNIEIKYFIIRLFILSKEN